MQNGARVRFPQGALLDYINLGASPSVATPREEDETTSPEQGDDLSEFPEMSEWVHEETRQGAYGHEYDPAFGVYTEKLCHPI